MVPTVSLTFDDGLDEHLDRAVPIIERHGVCGTFFVPISSPSFTNRMDEWRSIAHRGHELGNHTVFHPAWKSKKWVTPGIAIEGYNVDRMLSELELANKILYVIDGRKQRTYAYPCSNSILGRPGLAKTILRLLGLERTRLMGWVHQWPFLDIFSREQDYSQHLGRLFIAARSGETLTPRPAGEWNRFLIPCLQGDGKQATALFAETEQKLKAQGWVVLAFHGVDGGHHLSIPGSELDAFLSVIKESSEIRIAPFGEVAQELWGDKA